MAPPAPVSAAQLPLGTGAVTASQEPEQDTTAAPAAGAAAPLPAGLQSLLAVGVAPFQASPAAPVAQPPAAPAVTPPAASAPPPKADAADEVARLRAQVHGAAITKAITDAATTAQAIRPDQVVVLLRDELDVDASGRVFVKSDPRADVGAHVGRYLASNLHLLQPAVKGGGSGAPATVQPPTAAQAPAPASSTEGGTRIVREALSSILRVHQTPTAPPAQTPGAQR